MPVFEGLGKALRWLREKQGKRQYQVADEAGITKAMLSAYETGKQKPSLETLEKILDALGVGLPELAAALDHVNERGPSHRPYGHAGGPQSFLATDPTSVRSILGVEQLHREEEEALSEMLSGFHRLMRYFHRSVSDVVDPPGAADD